MVCLLLTLGHTNACIFLPQRQETTEKRKKEREKNLFLYVNSEVKMSSDFSFYKQTTIPGIATEESFPLPPKIGPYKIESILNKGGMSLLYLGLHPETKEPIAIKVLLPKYVNHPEMVKRFVKEAEIIALANHPNIVKVFGSGEWEGGLYIAMELIRGISLRQFILQHSLSLKRSLEIILQVSYALLHLHTHGVVHRDLKPENILITEDGEIKVIDFGIAQLHEEKEMKNTHVLGTPDYMSPEQKENPSKVSFASDIYSLGIIAYELILGKLSFGMINLSSLPGQLKTLIGKTIAVSLEERFQDIVDFITEISAYLKSDELQKEKPESDRIKELFETVQISDLLLSAPAIPEWPHIDIGLAKFKSPEQFGLYYDFFAWPNETYAVIIVQTLSKDIDSAIYSGVLRGMIKMYVQDKMANPKDPFRPLPFMTRLNQMLAKDHITTPIAMSVILLSPWKDELTFISCGLSGLLRLSSDSAAPYLLKQSNPPLGKNGNAEFLETTDNWKVGDTLIFHSLEETLEAPLLDATKKTVPLSTKRQPEAILKQVASSPFFPLQQYPKLILSISRTA